MRIAKGPIVFPVHPATMIYHLSATALRRTALKRIEGVAEYEDLSMVSKISVQGQGCMPAIQHSRGERRSMRLARDLGESDWDNG